MIRRRRGFVLSEDAAFDTEGVNPMHNLSNLPDVMLVLAVALLVALISYWNVDVAAGTAASPDPTKMQQVQGDFSSGAQTEALAGDQYKEVGTVYEDTSTGEMYLVTE